MYFSSSHPDVIMNKYCILSAQGPTHRNDIIIQHIVPGTYIRGYKNYDPPDQIYLVHKLRIVFPF